jgi:sugar/nucleoside kinase (ribokinase family)
MILNTGLKGRSISTRGGQSRFLPSTFRLIDTTGAGDILAEVFLALRSGGAATEVALRHAVAVATASVQSFGVDTTAVANGIGKVRLALGIVDRVGRT